MNEQFKTGEDAPRHLSAGKKASRDEFPDYAERVGRMADLLRAPALPWAEVALLLDIPVSTIDKLRAKGRGPRTITIGRRIYVRRADLDAWLDAMAESEAAS